MSDPGAELFSMIDKAAPFMDEGCPADKWPPSALLKISYSILATGRTGAAEAGAFVLQMLDRARQLWIDGLHPNPFVNDPQPRGKR